MLSTIMRSHRASIVSGPPGSYSNVTQRCLQCVQACVLPLFGDVVLKYSI